jgi:hypothetical protein
LKIIEITWGGTFSTGGYENEKLSATAQIDEGQSPDAAMQVLREYVLAQASRNAQEGYEHRRALLSELDKLRSNVERARAEWAKVVEFLKVQGIKSDTSEFPALTLLVPNIETEKFSLTVRDNDSSCEPEDLEF